VPATLQTFVIADVLPETPRAVLLRIDLGGRPFAFLAGQVVKAGAPGSPTRKPYSIASSPEDARERGWIELLIGLDDQGSAGAHLEVAAGARIEVEGPLGTFTFPPDAVERRFVFIAGGTGIAPLRAMMRHALALPGAQVGLVYSARTPDDFAFEGEFRALARERRIELRQTVTRAAGADWTGARGRIGRAELAPLVHDPETLCFICGPASLVDGTKALLETLGIARERIRVEEW
jgi:ferredoxin-NADP reductase